MINHILKYYRNSFENYVLLTDRDTSKINLSLIVDSHALSVYDLDLKSPFNSYSKEQLYEISLNTAIKVVKIYVGQKFSKEEFIVLNRKDERFIDMCINVKACINQNCLTHIGVVKLINGKYNLLKKGEKVILHLGQLKSLGIV